MHILDPIDFTLADKMSLDVQVFFVLFLVSFTVLTSGSSKSNLNLRSSSSDSTSKPPNFGLSVRIKPQRPISSFSILANYFRPVDSPTASSTSTISRTSSKTKIFSDDCIDSSSSDIDKQIAATVPSPSNSRSAKLGRIADKLIELAKFNEYKLIMSILDLSDDLIFLIFDFVLTEYSVIRLTSQRFKYLYDFRISNLCGMVLNNICDNYDNDKFSISRLILYVLEVESFLLKNGYSRFESDFALIISLLLSRPFEESCRAINAVLKLHLVSFEYFASFIFKYEENFRMIWREGLLQLAKEIQSSQSQNFFSLIGPEFEGLLTAVRFNRNPKLIHFLLQNFPENPTKTQFNYLLTVMKESANSNDWTTFYFIFDRFNKTKKLRAKFVTVLRHVVRTGKTEGLTILTQVAVDCPFDLAHIATEYDHINILYHLKVLGILYDASLSDKSGKTAVHYAAMFGRFECLRFLLDNQPEIDYLNISDEDGYLPIHFAAQSGNTKILEFIINSNSNSWIVGREMFPNNQSSPLHVAIECNFRDAVRILIEKFPQLVGVVDNSGYSAFHSACVFSDLELLQFLFSKSHDRSAIKKCDNDGNTLLHLAAIYGKEQLIRYLLKSGHFSGYKRNNRGYTAIGEYSRHFTNNSINVDYYYWIVFGLRERPSNLLISPIKRSFFR